MVRIRTNINAVFLQLAIEVHVPGVRKVRRVVVPPGKSANAPVTTRIEGFWPKLRHGVRELAPREAPLWMLINECALEHGATPVVTVALNLPLYEGKQLLTRWLRRTGRVGRTTQRHKKLLHTALGDAQALGDVPGAEAGPIQRNNLNAGHCGG